MKNEKGRGLRKVRSDKKIDIKPTVSRYVKRNLITIADLIDAPIMTAAELLVEEGIKSTIILELFQPIMIRNFYYKNCIFRATREDPPIKVWYYGKTEKVSFRLQQETFNQLGAVAYSISQTPTTTAALALRKTMYCRDFMEGLVQFELKHLEKARKEELLKFLSEMRMAEE